MAKSNVQTTRRKPTHPRALRMQVLRRDRVTPTFARVTLVGEDLRDLAPMGFDQWFRLFLPAGDDATASLGHVPDELTTANYAKYMLVPARQRPVIRNYTVRALREHGTQGRELDVDFVVHGSEEDGTAGPASAWAQSCRPGDEVAIIDEGTIYAGPEQDAPLLLAADEAALPAVAGILRDVPRGSTGTAVIEVPDLADRQDLGEPSGVEVRWVERQGRPGRGALAAMREVPVPDGVYAWVAGESGLPTALRRHWVKAGVPKAAISFCGYWKAGAAH